MLGLSSSVIFAEAAYCGGAAISSIAEVGPLNVGLAKMPEASHTTDGILPKESEPVMSQFGVQRTVDRPNRSQLRHVPYAATALAVGPVFRHAYRLRVVCPERIPAEGPLVVVANHESNLDGFVLISVFAQRRLTFLSAAHLFEKPAIGRYLRAIGALPVEEQCANLTSFKSALAILATGGTVAVFPQGGIDSNEIRGERPTLRSRPTPRCCRSTSQGRRRLFHPTVGGPPWLASRCVSVCP